MAFVTALGFGGGALSTGILISIDFTIRPPTFWIVLIGLTVGLFVGSFILPKDEKLASDIRIIRLPLFPKGVGRFNLSIALFWSVTGVIIGILPSQLALFNLGNWSGFSLFLVSGTGALCLPFARKLTIDRALLISYILLPVGLAFISFGSLSGSLSWVLIGCSTLGSVNLGVGYYATLNGAGGLNPRQKSRVVAGYLISAYVGFGGAPLVIGFVADHFGLKNVLIIYLILTTTLSMILLFRQICRSRQK